MSQWVCGHDRIAISGSQHAHELECEAGFAFMVGRRGGNAVKEISGDIRSRPCGRKHIKRNHERRP